MLGYLEPVARLDRRQRRPGQLEHLEGAARPEDVVWMELGGGDRVHQRERFVQGGGAFFRHERLMLRPQRFVLGRAFRQAVEERAHPQERPAADHRHVAALPDRRDGRFR